MSRSVLMLSGGPDSATVTKWAMANGHDDLRAIYLSTGHATDDNELAAADLVAAEVGAPLEIIDVSQMVAALGGRKLLIHSEANIMPFGNAIALSIAVTYARSISATSILMGLHADDAAESAEYRRPFIDGIEALARTTKSDISILTPFLDMTKSEVFRLGAELGVAYAATWSCIRPGTLHCGFCGACRARARALESIGMADETRYGRPVAALASANSH